MTNFNSNDEINALWGDNNVEPDPKPSEFEVRWDDEEPHGVLSGEVEISFEEGTEA